jgi:hypothetical protein
MIRPPAVTLRLLYRGSLDAVAFEAVPLGVELLARPHGQGDER